MRRCFNTYYSPRGLKEIICIRLQHVIFTQWRIIIILYQFLIPNPQSLSSLKVTVLYTLLSVFLLEAIARLPPPGPGFSEKKWPYLALKKCLCLVDIHTLYFYTPDTLGKYFAGNTQIGQDPLLFKLTRAGPLELEHSSMCGHVGSNMSFFMIILICNSM